MGEWIRVKDRPPEIGVEVYAYFHNGLQTKAVRWHENDRHWTDGFITHWMPLSDPPKESEK